MTALGPVNDMQFTILVLGDCMVGKTSLVKRFLGKGFDGMYPFTIGADCFQDASLKFWDLAGDHKIAEKLIPPLVPHLNGAVVVCDASRRDSLDSLSKWKERVAKLNIPIIEVANRSDLESGCELPEYIHRVSAKDNIGIALALDDLVGQMLRKRLS